VPDFVPYRPQNRLDCPAFERLNCGLLRLRANMAVPFEHLARDVARKGFDGLFAHSWILAKP
jgi:hypothetical protein